MSLYSVPSVYCGPLLAWGDVVFLWRRPEFFITSRAAAVPFPSQHYHLALVSSEDCTSCMLSFFFLVHFFIPRFIGGGGAVLSTCAAQCVILG